MLDKTLNESEETSSQPHSHLLMHEKNLLNKEIFNTQQKLKKLELLQYEALIKYNIPSGKKDLKITSSPTENPYDLDQLADRKVTLTKQIEDMTESITKLN